MLKVLMTILVSCFSGVANARLTIYNYRDKIILEFW